MHVLYKATISFAFFKFPYIQSTQILNLENGDKTLYMWGPWKSTQCSRDVAYYSTRKRFNIRQWLRHCCSLYYLSTYTAYWSQLCVSTAMTPPPYIYSLLLPHTPRVAYYSLVFPLYNSVTSFHHDVYYCYTSTCFVLMSHTYVKKSCRFSYFFFILFQGGGGYIQSKGILATR